MAAHFMITVLHLTITLFILSPVVYPIAWLEGGAYLMPLMWSVYWFIFDGCHLTKNTYKNEKDPSYVLKILTAIGFNITKSQSNKFTQTVMVFIPTFICFRLINKIDIKY
jgi:hypothetical protein